MRIRHERVKKKKHDFVNSDAVDNSAEVRHSKNVVNKNNTPEQAETEGSTCDGTYSRTSIFATTR